MLILRHSLCVESGQPGGDSFQTVQDIHDSRANVLSQETVAHLNRLLFPF